MTDRKGERTTTLEEASRQLLREDPVGYSATRNRQLRAALLEGDQEQVETLLIDVAGVVGRNNAKLWKLHVMDKIVEESLKNQE